MIKTVILDGTEQCVTGLGGSNAVIANFGRSTLYASAYPDIVPDGKNVAAISAGNAINLPDTNGTVYLLGSGRVQLEGTDYKTVNVSLSSSGGGGDTPGGDTMPYMNGITAIFTADTFSGGDKWFDETGTVYIETHNAKQDNRGVAFKAPDSAHGRYSTDVLPSVIYMVGQQDHSQLQTQMGIITKQLSVSDSKYSFDLGSTTRSTSSGMDNWIPRPALFANGTQVFDYNGDTMQAHVYCIQRDGNKAVLYADAGKYGEIESDFLTQEYAGGIILNGFQRGTSAITVSQNSSYFKMIAFGTEPHTASQIRQNSIWLLDKYLGGD